MEIHHKKSLAAYTPMLADYYKERIGFGAFLNGFKTNYPSFVKVITTADIMRANGLSVPKDFADKYLNTEGLEQGIRMVLDMKPLYHGFGWLRYANEEYKSDLRIRNWIVPNKTSVIEDDFVLVEALSTRFLKIRAFRRYPDKGMVELTNKQHERLPSLVSRSQPVALLQNIPTLVPLIESEITTLVDSLLSSTKWTRNEIADILSPQIQVCSNKVIEERGKRKLVHQSTNLQSNEIWERWSMTALHVLKRIKAEEDELREM